MRNSSMACRNNTFMSHSVVTITIRCLNIKKIMIISNNSMHMRTDSYIVNSHIQYTHLHLIIKNFQEAEVRTKINT